jgi:hypothetical protein
MKLKNKIYTLLSVFTLVGLTHSLTLKDLNAVLTAPSGWTFKYTNEDFPGFKIRSTTAVITTPQYTRTADGAYYNYTNTSTITNGLTVQQTFNRSNTTWYDNLGLYIPSSATIGSNSSVGTLSSKVEYIFNNQTNKDYFLFMDMASSSGNRLMRMYYDGVRLTNANDDTQPYYDGALQREYIPSYTEFKWYSYSTGLDIYFDAWYLIDLGVSDAYNEGYDQGSFDANENADLLITGFTAMVGILVNFVLMIVNLEVLGVSILGIFSIVILFTTIVWVLKLIRG